MNVFVNEFHYDNDGGDIGEFIEVAGVSGADLTGWTIALYNGNGGGIYGTLTLSGVIPDEGAGFGALSFPAAGLQNGAPDGFALVDASGAVVEFLSYEGSFTAVGGPADGMTSTDVGVEEPGSTPTGFSLQRTGSGLLPSDFAWSGPADGSPGALNAGQRFAAAGFDLQITEIWPGNANGSNLTSDWFEVTNIGDAAWSLADGALYFDDESADPADAAILNGVTEIAPGESVVFVDDDDDGAFRAVWGPVIELGQVGTYAGAGLGQGGDAVALFLDDEGDGVDAGDLIDLEAYPDANAAGGASYDVTAGAFSVDGGAGDGVVTTAVNDEGEPAVGSPTNGEEAEPDVAAFTLELLHFTDQEASTGAIVDAPNLSAVLAALRLQDLGEDGVEDNTITLSSGDAFIPGVFYDASAAVFGSAGIADIQIQNELGVEAVALGNHEFDFGTAFLAGLIDGSAPGDFSALSGTDLDGLDFMGTAFPYLSANLDFSTDASMAPLEVAGGQAPMGNVVASSTVIEKGGELIGVVGATTPTLDFISSPGDVTVLPEIFDGDPTDEQLDALAAIIQAEVDALLDANPAMNKVILLAHMQQIAIELDLAARLTDVDIIVAGGSNTRLFDDNDRPRDGDSDQGQYPQFVTDAAGGTTAVVNTDGSYKYVGRLVIDFDENGEIIAESYDETVSGAYATDAQGVADLGAEGLIDPEIQAIADAIEAQIIATESNVFGISDVFLNGNRNGLDDPNDPDGVRNQQTNLGDLTADANLAAAKAVDDTVLISIKNGGGIRASVGETVVLPGDVVATRLPNGELVDGDGNVVKPAGGISQNDIATTLAFNNGLTLLTVTRAELVAVLEHGVGDLGGGRFPQISGVEFSYDPDLPVGDRVVSAAIVDETGEVIEVLVQNGEIAGDPDQSFRIVTLNFLAGGGDGYPFDALSSPDRLDLYDLDGDGANDGAFTGDATFAEDGTEQDALAEYLDDNFATPETAFAMEDVGRADDERIQNLNFREDTVLDGVGPDAPVATEELGDIAVAAFLDSLSGEGGSEVVAHEDGRLYVTNGAAGRIDVWDIGAASLVGSVDLTVLPGFAGVQSVAVKNGLIAAAVSTPNLTSTVFGQTIVEGRDGYVALIDAASLTVIDRVNVGALPDMVTFNGDGTKILVANEGEFNAENGLDRDPIGGVSIIDVSDLIDPTVVDITFEAFDGLEAIARANGIRLADGASLLRGLEPEYITIQGDTAYVSLQEANAIAVLDIATGAFTNIFTAGVQDHSLVGLDPNDDGQIAIDTYDNLVGLRMPDAITSFVLDGQTYLVTANEGDGRGDATDPNGDEARVGDILAGDIPGLSIDASVDTTGLERLTVSTIDGDTDGDGDIDVLHAFGSRSFTIFDADGNVVFDSGDEIERIIADLAPERFNNDDGEPIATEDDNRSDAKGPEPEAVAVGEIDGQLYAFIGLERDSGVLIYNITAPADAYFVDYIPGFGNGDIPGALDEVVGPETIAFISAEDSTSGVAQIAVAYEITGDTVVYDLGAFIAEPVATLISEFQPNPDGTDPATVAVELSGQPGASFDLWLVAVESDVSSAVGTIDRAMNVTGTFDANGLATVMVDDLENPSFTYILADGFTGAVGDDIDLDDDGVADDLSMFGTILDALGVPDADGEALYGAQLGGVDLANIGTEPRLVFRDGSRGDWYAVEGNGTTIYDADANVVDAAEFDVDPSAGTDTFGALNPVRVGLQPDLQITEIWAGQDGDDLTEDWFEITNMGPVAWTAEAFGSLFYDDESMSAEDADLIEGIDEIAPGESVIVVIGDAADAAAFAAVWSSTSPALSPAISETTVGYADGAGLGAGGDAVTLFQGETASADNIVDMEAYPDQAGFSGQSYDVVNGQYSTVAALDGVVATTATAGEDGTEPAVGSPGLVPQPAAEITLISAIQGSSDFASLPNLPVVGVDDRSALEGSIVTISAVVTAEFLSGLGGFFVQEEDADQDGDASTSEGIYVFANGLTLDLQVGDLVEVTGTVAEFFGETQISASAVEVIATGQLLPTATVLDLGSQGVMVDQDGDYVADLEAYEGMLVTFPEDLFVTELFQLDRFGTVRLSSEGRLEQFTQSNAPDAAGYDQHLQDNGARSIVIDDGSSVQNPDPILIPDGNDGALASTDSFRMGDILQNVTGVLAYSEDFQSSSEEPEFRIHLPSADYVEANPRPEAPEDIGGNFKVASLNVLNYFTTLDTNPGSFNGPNNSGPNDDQEPRGANTAEEFERQATKLVNAIVAMDADVLGLLEIENDDDIAIADLVSRVNAALGSVIYDYVPTGDTGTDAITTGIMYKIETAIPTGDAAVLIEFNGESFVDPLDTGSQRNRPAVAQTFTDADSGQTLTVVVNHLKSKGSGTGAAEDEDQLDGAGSSNGTRTEGARILAEWLASDPTGTGAANQLIVGDLNAYAEEDPIRALEAAGFTDLAEAFIGDDAYSFVFDGQTGTLDYALANAALLELVAGVTEWHVNADEADAIDYNLDFGRDPAFFDGTTAARNSDHDPVIVSFDFEPEILSIIGTDGRDKLVGTAADELIDGLGNKDKMTGNGGADIFVLTKGDQVLDFNPEEGDKLDVSGWGVQSFEELTLYGGRDFKVVDFGSGNHTNSRFADPASRASDLTEDNFIFAPIEDLTVTGGDGPDKLYGRAGDDIISGGGGFNVFTGNGGDDLFVLSEGSTNRIEDFQVGHDRIDVSDWGVESIDDLYIRGNGRVVVRDGDSQLVVLSDDPDFRASDLTPESFVFADPLS